MDDGKTYLKKGYLKENFRLFHLKDSAGQELDFHYHEFDKIVIFLSGKVNYTVEGISYNLEHGDVVLVSHHMMHKAVIDTAVPYERVIIYVNTGFVEANSTPGESLMSCFRAAEKKNFCLLRAPKEDVQFLLEVVTRLEEAVKSSRFGSDIMAKTLFLQFLVYLNRLQLSDDTKNDSTAYDYDPMIAEILTYINENLDKQLGIEELASRCYISKYHFMRKFKDITGYTVHNYICQKRLISVVALMRKGVPVTKASALCGFQDYSTFIRAFRKMFNTSPGKFI